MDKDTFEASIWNFRYVIERKSHLKRLNIWIFLNQLLWFFHDRDLTSDEKGKDCTSHDLEFRNPVIIKHLSSWEIQASEVGKSWTIKHLMFQSRKCWKQVIIECYRYLTLYRQGTDERKTRWSTRIACCRIWNRWQVWNLLLVKIWTLVSWQKIKELYVLGEIGIWLVMLKGFYKVWYRGEILLWVRSVEGFLRERFIRNASDRISH